MDTQTFQETLDQRETEQAQQEKFDQLIKLLTEIRDLLKEPKESASIKP